MERHLVYAVTATMPAASLDTYIRWLLDGHIQAVVAGGALRAEVTRFEAPAGRVESRYLFADAAAFARYEAEVAPALRAEGVAFAARHDVRFSRAVGRLAAEHPSG